MTTYGPYESQADIAPDVADIHEAARTSSGVGAMQPHIRRRLLDTLAAAGVELGAYDQRVAGWLSTWEAETVQVICGWISRASGGGQ